eukprot:GSMAST32.ASY1.ANO1.268.1 assembled CDS
MIALNRLTIRPYSWHLPHLYQRGLRFISDKTDSPKDRKRREAIEYLLALGSDYDEDVATAMVDVFDRPGTGGASVASLKAMGKSGLQALSTSVKHEMNLRREKHKNKQQVTLHVSVPHERSSFSMKAFEGDTLFDIIESSDGEELSNFLECACSGLMACSTCHVIVDEDSFKHLSPPSEAELDMLDLADGVCPTSRLGCQLVLPYISQGKEDLNHEEVNSFHITIPEFHTNFYN